MPASIIAEIFRIPFELLAEFLLEVVAHTTGRFILHLVGAVRGKPFQVVYIPKPVPEKVEKPWRKRFREKRQIRLKALSNKRGHDAFIQADFVTLIGVLFWLGMLAIGAMLGFLLKP